MKSDSVLIVGAGPTGLALACDLFRRGVQCRIVDSSPTRSDHSKALAIWPRTLEVLEDLGSAGAALDRGLRLSKGVIWSGARRVAGFDLSGVASRYKYGLVLPQYETEAILEERLNDLGGCLERGVECLGVRPGKVDAIAELRVGTDVESVRADWIVGCDGSGSVVREGAGIAMPQRLEREGWLLADVEIETTLEPDAVNYFLSEHGVLHMVPMPSDRDGRPLWRLTLNVGPHRPDASDWPLERLAAVAARRAAVPVRVMDIEWTSGFRIRQGLAREFRQGRVFLAGDAAHVHSPAGGQGINTGLQDAINLGWKLARICAGGRPDVLLDSYSAERRPAVRAVVHATDRATRIGAATPGFAVPARDRLWSFADRHGLIDRWVTPALAGLAQRYPETHTGHTDRGGPVRRGVAKVVAGRRPGAGSRLSNVQVRRRWLWDEVSSLRSSVIVCEDMDQQVREALIRALPVGTPTVPVSADAGRTLKIAGNTVIVVRPDRYIGLRCAATKLQLIVGYLRTVEGTDPCPMPAT